MGMTGLRLSYLFLESANGLAIVPGCNRRYSSLERTGFRDALGLHVFQKLRSDFCLFDQINNSFSLELVYRPAGSVVIIPDNHDVEDVAGDVAAKERVGAAYRLHVRLATRGVRRGRHKGIFIMAALRWTPKMRQLAKVEPCP